MRSPQPTWHRRTPRTVVAALIVWTCVILSGCQSICLGPLLADRAVERAAPTRARLGAPIPRADRPDANAADSLVPVQHQANESDAPAAGRPIDLTTALALAAVENPTIALAEEAVRARLAERMQARALLFPTLDAGANLRIHRGNVLTGRGVVLDAHLQSFYYGDRKSVV